MTLSVTGSPVLIGDPNIAQIEFLPTDMDAVARVLRGASWRHYPRDARVWGYNGRDPHRYGDTGGVRWAALLRP
jgi:hypothetical protein